MHDKETMIAALQQLMKVLHQMPDDMPSKKPEGEMSVELEMEPKEEPKELAMAEGEEGGGKDIPFVEGMDEMMKKKKGGKGC